ncbi:MAG: hypothetical protein HY290_10090 [Planctomycetia bacterium]|nr:hypothetical protein [Planctomycetia bacterium]
MNGNGVLDYHYLPSSFALNTLGKVRVEVQERRYTWLLTVRQNATNSANVDVVVFFKRALENIATDEMLHDARFTMGSTKVNVTYLTGNNPTTGLPYKPYMRRGSYVLDANNAFWYRINSVTDDNAGNAVLTLEVPANATNYSQSPLAPPKAIFPRAVVDVYPIGSKSYQSYQ